MCNLRSCANQSWPREAVQVLLNHAAAFTDTQGGWSATGAHLRGGEETTGTRSYPHWGDWRPQNEMGGGWGQRWVGGQGDLEWFGGCGGVPRAQLLWPVMTFPSRNADRLSILQHWTTFMCETQQIPISESPSPDGTSVLYKTLSFEI